MKTAKSGHQLLVLGYCLSWCIRICLGQSLLLLALLSVFGASSRAQAPSRPPSEDQEVAAWVNGNPIRLKEVDSYLGREAYLLKKKLYQLRIQAINGLAQKYLITVEAKRQNLPEAALLDRIVAAADAVTEADIDKEWAENIAVLRPFGEVSGKYEIVLSLTNRRKMAALERYLAELKQNVDIRYEIMEPTLTLVARPSRSFLGNPTAPLTLTVFLDYECPSCKRIHQQLYDLLSQEPFRSNLRMAVKHFPLPSHATATKAAIAAICAQRADKFEEMHQQLLHQSEHDEPNLLRAAEQISLDLDAFKNCMASRSARDEVFEDQAEGHLNGVDSTPTMYFNGELLSTLDLEAIQSRLKAAIPGRDSAPTLSKPLERR